MDWLRWHHGTVTDPKWRVIARKSGRSVGDVIAVFACLLERASQHETRGTIAGWGADDIGACLDMDSDTVTGIINAMQGKVLDGDNLSGWSKRQPKRDDGSAERAKEWRERNRTQPNATKHREDKSREDKKEPPKAPPRVGRARGSRLSPDWVLEPEQRDYATSRGLDPDRLAEDFRAYWLAKAGSGAAKVDWNLTWQTWVRREADRKPSTPALAKQTAPTATGGVADSQKVAALVAQSVRWVQTPDGMKRERVA
jgi:hypothetical protein